MIAPAPPPAAPTARTHTLAFVLLAAVAVVGGIALWPAPGTAAASRQPDRRPCGPFPAELATEIEDLARGALAVMGDPQRRAAAAPGCGVAWTALDATARGVLEQLFVRSAAVLRGEHARAELERLGARDAPTFAWDGGAGGAPFHVRMQCGQLVLEWVRTADGELYGDWRDAAGDAARPSLRDRALPARR